MQTHSIIVATALLAASFATPGFAAGHGGGMSGNVWTGGGGASSGGFSGGGSPNAGGFSGGVGSPSHGPSGLGPSFRSSNAFTPSGPTGNFKPQGAGLGTQSRVAGRDLGADQDWRQHRRHHYYPGVGSGVWDAYVDQDYDDSGDQANCWVYRKAHDRAGHFLGWKHVDLCQG